MAVRADSEIEKRALEMGAAIMVVSARTAPKTRGLDSIKMAIVDGEELEKLAKAMEAKYKEKSTELPGFKRDAGSLRESGAVLLIGVSRNPKRMELPLNCGACGYKDCKELLAAGEKVGEDFTGPICVFQALDLGIALGSAVKMASEFNIDNRIMYTIGAAAKKLNLLEADLIMGIPLSITGKNIYFDRP